MKFAFITEADFKSGGASFTPNFSPSPSGTPWEAGNGTKAFASRSSYKLRRQAFARRQGSVARTRKRAFRIPGRTSAFSALQATLLNLRAGWPQGLSRLRSHAAKTWPPLSISYTYRMGILHSPRNGQPLFSPHNRESCISGTLHKDNRTYNRRRQFPISANFRDRP